MAQPYRTAVIGTSWWADGYHLPALRARQDVDLVALCGRDQKRLREVAARHTIRMTFTDVARMLEQAQPDLVVILTPNHLHHPLALQALDAGAHVICEKPLALNAGQATEMLRRAQDSQRRHLTFFTYRGLLGARQVKHLLEAGFLGQLYHLDMSYLHGSWLDPRRPASWKTHREEAGAGVLADLGAHVIDLLHWWCGAITRVAGSLQVFIERRPGAEGIMEQVTTDDAAAFLAEFASGGQAQVQLSRVAPTRHNFLQARLYGAEGTLVMTYEHALEAPGHLLGAHAHEAHLRPLEIASGPEDDTFPAVHARLTGGFFSGQGDYPTFADGLAAQRVIDAVARAAQNGRWETVPTT